MTDWPFAVNAAGTAVALTLGVWNAADSWRNSRRARRAEARRQHGAALGALTTAHQDLSTVAGQDTPGERLHAWRTLVAVRPEAGLWPGMIGATSAVCSDRVTDLVRQGALSYGDAFAAVEGYVMDDEKGPAARAAVGELRAKIAALAAARP